MKHSRVIFTAGCGTKKPTHRSRSKEAQEIDI
jgi:hypothetical protein